LFPEHRCRRGGDVDLWLRIMSRTDALSTPHIGATYFRNSVNMTTMIESVNRRSPLCESIENMLLTADPVLAKRLRKVYNLQMFINTLNVVGNEELSPDVYRGFFVSDNPVKYLLIRILAALPLWVQGHCESHQRLCENAYRAVFMRCFP
jgi:hypothetical protein